MFWGMPVIFTLRSSQPEPCLSNISLHKEIKTQENKSHMRKRTKTGGPRKRKKEKEREETWEEIGRKEGKQE